MAGRRKEVQQKDSQTGTGGQKKNSQDYSPMGKGGAEEESAELFASSDKGTGKGDQSDGGGMEE